MAVIPYTTKGLKLLARLMRAEAVSDGKLAMLMVGNVGVNRVRCDCLDFVHINNIREMVFQQPGGFEAVQYGFFYRPAREQDIRLARKVVKGNRYHPATYALWFFEPQGDCPAQWFGEWNTGRYKSHCFYKPTESECPGVYSAF